MITVLEKFCTNYDFPHEATNHLLAILQKLINKKTEYYELLKLVSDYEKDYNSAVRSVFEKLDVISKKTNIHPYTLNLIYLILLTPGLKNIYSKRNIPNDIYDSSVLDLKYKLLECKNVYNVWGIFVGWWTIDFFRLERFGIGRLQYNLKKFSSDLTSASGKISVKKGDLYLDTHIPSGSSLIYEECRKSYKDASVFFKECFGDKPIIFGCYSWLISPDNELILAENSNILRFGKDYEFIFREKGNSYSNLWHIFNVTELPPNIETLPEKTSLQKGYKHLIKQGKTIDQAFGIMKW